MSAMTAMKPLLAAITVSSVWVSLNGAAPTRTTRPVPSTLCDIKLPDISKKKEDAPARKDAPSQAASAPMQLPARTDELIAAGKTAEAQQFLEGWLRVEIRNRNISGMAKAQADQDPSDELREIIALEQTAHKRYGATLKLNDTGGIAAAQQVMSTYVKKHMPKLVKEGTALAAQGLPEMPPQVTEMIALDKQAANLGLTVTWLAEAGSILGKWGEVRNEKLYREAMSLAKAAEREPPHKQLKEMIEISRNVALLNATGKWTGDGVIEYVRGVLTEWSNLRVKKLRDTGLPIANQPAATPPADEIVQLHEVAQWIQSLEITTGRGAEAQQEANSMADTWLRKHADRLYNRGAAAAASGGPTPPAEIDSIVKFARANGCAGAKESGAVEYALARARTLGEKHLSAYRDKLDCKPTAAQKATLDKIIAHLVSYGWGPYGSGENVCDWTGTITMTMISESDRTTDFEGGGDGVRETVTIRDTSVYEVAVMGATGAAKVSGGGTKMLIKKRIAGTCRADSVEEATKSVVSGTATIPISIQGTPTTTYAIRFPNIASRIANQTTTYSTGVTSKACIPVKRGTSTSTMNLDIAASKPDKLIVAKPIVTPKTPGARGTIVLQDSTSTQIGTTRLIVSYKLKRSQ